MLKSCLMNIRKTLKILPSNIVKTSLESLSTVNMWNKQPNKYKRVKTQKAGKWFDSKLESAVHDKLIEMELAGEITDIKLQDTVYLTDANIQYRADFSCMRNSVKEWHEAKGFETDIWRIKRRLWISYGPGTLYIWKGSYNSPKLFETLISKK